MISSSIKNTKSIIPNTAQLYCRSVSSSPSCRGSMLLFVPKRITITCMIGHRNIEYLSEKLPGTPSENFVGIASGRKSRLIMAITHPSPQTIHDNFMLFCIFIDVLPPHNFYPDYSTAPISLQQLPPSLCSSHSPLFRSPLAIFQIPWYHTFHRQQS